MPRGNDSQSALVDLQGEYGTGTTNAQLLIDSARALITPELRAANLKKREVDEDGKPLKPKVSEVQKKVGDQGTVLDTAVRGGYVVAVVEAESGRTYKDVWPASDFSLKSEASQPAKVEESEDEKATRENVRATLAEVSEASQREREADKAAEEARREHLEKAQKASQSSSAAQSSQGQQGGSSKS